MMDVRPTGNRGQGSPERTSRLSPLCPGARVAVRRGALVSVVLMAASASFASHGAAHARAAPAPLPGRLYFTRGAFLYASNPDGSGARRLTAYGTTRNPDIMPAVSRDGTRLVYVQRNQPGRGNVAGLYALRADGSDRRNISGTDQTPLNPSLSPDGTQVLYDTTVIYTYPSYTVYAESIIRRLSDRTSLNLFGNGRSPQLSPSWSPDGGVVAMAQINNVSTGQTGLVAVYIGAMRAQAPGQRNYEIAAPLTTDAAHSYNTPSYAPDGRFIACVRTSPSGRVGDLYVMNNDGTGGHVVALRARLLRPAWSPDGAAIAYSSGGAVVVVSAASGRVLATIPNAYGAAWGGRVTVAPVHQRMLATPPSTPVPGGATATPSVSPGSAGAGIIITKVDVQAIVNGQTFDNQGGIADNQTGHVIVSYTATGGTPTGVVRLVGRIHKGRVFLEGPLQAGPGGTLTFDLKPMGAADDDVYDAYITLTNGSATVTKDAEISISPAL